MYKVFYVALGIVGFVHLQVDESFYYDYDVCAFILKAYKLEKFEKVIIVTVTVQHVILFVFQMAEGKTTCQQHIELLEDYWRRGLTAPKTPEPNVLAAEICSQTGLEHMQLKVTFIVAMFCSL
jgi:hypothetical protein